MQTTGNSGAETERSALSIAFEIIFQKVKELEITKREHKKSKIK